MNKPEFPKPFINKLSAGAVTLEYEQYDKDDIQRYAEAYHKWKMGEPVATFDIGINQTCGAISYNPGINPLVSNQPLYAPKDTE